MTESHPHTILIVDTDKGTFKILGVLLEKEEGATCYFAETGEDGIKMVKETRPKFSIIIAENKLKGISGTEFLKQVQGISPFSSRFLMSDHSDTQAIVKAVNSGIIQRYIEKPLKQETFSRTIKSGIRSYKFFIESEKLFRLAKKQNKKLYELGCELMEATKGYTRELEELEESIEQKKKEIKTLSTGTESSPDHLSDKLTPFLKKEEEPGANRMESLYCKSLQELARQFNELALRKGFEMSLPGMQGNEEGTAEANEPEK